MNGESSNSSGVLGDVSVESTSTTHAHPSRFRTKTQTEFQSITTVEPMYEYPTESVPLEMSFEEHEKTEASDCSYTIGPVKQPIPPDVKKPRFEYVKTFKEDMESGVHSPIKAEPEVFDDVEQYENVDLTKSEDMTEDLAMQIPTRCSTSESETRLTGQLVIGLENQMRTAVFVNILERPLVVESHVDVDESPAKPCFATAHPTKQCRKHRAGTAQSSRAGQPVESDQSGTIHVVHCICQ
ncbi:unnamed protein product [Echinostoma caproni]|uniref:Uncharacterized protein n=1 Tax=Echinostoma caproni TaxID=27848 RepID=A0A183AVE2_9TREM|nr:unnamed protein product [Echinostoma caproni]